MERLNKISIQIKLRSEFFILTLLTTSLVSAGPGDEFLVIESSKYQTRSPVGKVDMLTYNGKDFTVTQSGKSKTIHRYDLDPSLRGRTVKEVSGLLKNSGYLVLKRRGNDIAIDAEKRIHGGSSGPGQIPPSQVDGARYQAMAEFYNQKAKEEKAAKSQGKKKPVKK